MVWFSTAPGLVLVCSYSGVSSSCPVLVWFKSGSDLVQILSKSSSRLVLVWYRFWSDPGFVLVLSGSSFSLDLTSPGLVLSPGRVTDTSHWAKFFFC